MTVPKSIVIQKINYVSGAVENQYAFISFIVLTAVSFAAKLGFNALAANPASSHGLFIHGISGVSKLFPLNITPAGWTFSIWSVIFFLEAATVVYGLTLLCRSTPSGPAYRNPTILSPSYFILLTSNNVFTIAWLFTWDRLFLFASSLFLCCSALSLYLSLAIASTRLKYYQDDLINQNRTFDLRYIQVVVLNGFGIYATWGTIATLINIGVTLAYRVGQPFSVETASIVSLSILGTVVLVYSSLDSSLLDTYTRFIFTPYVTVIWALSGVLAKNWDANHVSSILSVVLLSLTAIAFVLKIVLVALREERNDNPYREMKRGSAPQ